ncbi:MAG: Asp-tRNA(Asn)/Glu-tRNA(Gln) amidotransferase subunit GatB [Anaerolineae bacterium]|nr:Asp-tRNA(Asn)/Glu-tRNA(Gln) amidotransferase subunit GatB [Anaerolineae bacterium]
MEYDVIIGMETHVELDTHSKMFCTCSAQWFGAEPNVHVCPTCAGMPGALPVINRRAVEFSMMLGVALNCSINQHTFWERKSYWYPDLPKGYQITQYQYPMCYDGYLEFDVRDLSGGWNEQSYRKRVRIRRAHLEEDTGKLTHAGRSSYVDYNRSGVPLLEIVTEPDIFNAHEAYAYLSALQDIVRYLGISTGDMEKGAMRCEPNMSLRPKGTDAFGTKVEIKNLNSLSAVRGAIAYEIKRQSAALDKGEKIRQVTLGWDDVRGVTVMQREKEDAHDYRYFPEPDLPPLDVSDDWLALVRASVPELPIAKQARYQNEFGLSAYDAVQLTTNRDVAKWFETGIKALNDEKAVHALAKRFANFVIGDLTRLMNASGLQIEQIKITPAQLAGLVKLVEVQTINSSTAKLVLEEMFGSGADANAIVQAKGLAQVSDSSVLEKAVEDVLAANPKEVDNYLKGNEKLLQFLVGQTMKASKGKANPQMIQGLMKAALEKRR